MKLQSALMRGRFTVPCCNHSFYCLKIIEPGEDLISYFCALFEFVLRTAVNFIHRHTGIGTPLTVTERLFSWVRSRHSLQCLLSGLLSSIHSD